MSTLYSQATFSDGNVLSFGKPLLVISSLSVMLCTGSHSETRRIAGSFSIWQVWFTTPPVSVHSEFCTMFVNKYCLSVVISSSLEEIRSSHTVGQKSVFCRSTQMVIKSQWDPATFRVGHALRERHKSISSNLVSLSLSHSPRNNKDHSLRQIAVKTRTAILDISIPARQRP
ncbi:unnamed protein product [Heterotrigona itama]|uniref:Uncharacterized protein n=1 Tax=Heterotrigona itama TaxID=395501 RepID=A0A6V7HG07_9HYME|nr:unnamed protein product [Heterotrigona itama]